MDAGDLTGLAEMGPEKQNWDGKRVSNSTSVPKISPVGVRTAALAILTALLWGGNPVAVSYSVDTVPPIAVAGIRFALASAFMLLWCRGEGSELRIRPGQGRPVLLAGFGLFLQITTFNIGVWLSNSSHASMMINTFVFWVMLVEHFFTRQDQLDLRKFSGLVFATGGIVLLLWSSPLTRGQDVADAPSLIGDVIVLFSAWLLAVKIVYVKHALRRVEPGKLIFWHDVVGTCGFFVSSLLLEDLSAPEFTLPAVLGLLYQGLFVAGLCFAIQARLLRRHSASQIAIFSFATPLFGVALGVILRGDPLTAWLFVAAALIAAGIGLVNLR